MITADQWEKFFAAFERTGVLKTACRASGIGRRTVYDHKQAGEDKDATPEAKAWLARFKEANEEAGDTVEEEIFRRGVEGVEEPLIGRVGKDQDGVVCMVRRYSDALLIRLAQARRPEKFKDRVASEVSGPGGGPVKTESSVMVLPAIPPESPE